MKKFILVICLILLSCSILLGCATIYQGKPDVDSIRDHNYFKTSNCSLHSTYYWQTLPDKIDQWQYRIYAPYIQNCYQLESED